MGRFWCEYTPNGLWYGCKACKKKEKHVQIVAIEDIEYWEIEGSRRTGVVVSSMKNSSKLGETRLGSLSRLDVHYIFDPSDGTLPFNDMMCSICHKILGYEIPQIGKFVLFYDTLTYL